MDSLWVSEPVTADRYLSQRLRSPVEKTRTYSRTLYQTNYSRTLYQTTYSRTLYQTNYSRTLYQTN